MFKNIKNFIHEIIQFFKNFMGPDLTEAELLEGEYENDYFYQKLHGFNELDQEDRRILDEAMEDVVREDSSMGMEEALKAARKDKLSLKGTSKSTTKQQAKAMPQRDEKEPQPKESKGVDKDR